MKNQLKFLAALFLFGIGSLLFAQSNITAAEDTHLTKAQTEMEILKSQIDLTKSEEAEILEVLKEKNVFMADENISPMRRNITVKDGFLDHIKSILTKENSAEGLVKFQKLVNNPNLLEKLNLHQIPEEDKIR